MWWAGYMCLFHIPCGICFCQELAKLDDIRLSYHENKKGDLFLRHTINGTYTLFICILFVLMLANQVLFCTPVTARPL